MKKYLGKGLVGLVLTLGLTLGVASAQAQPKGKIFDFEEAPKEQVVAKTTGQITTGKLAPIKSTYVFGSLGSTTNGKSSTVTTIGIGQDIFYFADNHIILGVEGAFTHFTGKRLDSLNNNGTEGFAVVDEKNLIELGAKLSYQFNELDPLNVRVFGKAGIASSTLKNGNQISPYVSAGVELNPQNTNFVWVLEAKHYTDLQKAKVYYEKDRGANFNTRKDNTVVSLGLQYRF